MYDGFLSRSSFRLERRSRSVYSAINRPTASAHRIETAARRSPWKDLLDLNVDFRVETVFLGTNVTKTSKIWIIVPSQPGGVMDFAEIFASRLAEQVPHAVETLVLTEQNQGDFSSDSGNRLYFIQVSGYGYQERGVPLFLVEWARREKVKGARIACFFHELYAFGPPWRSSFWLSPVQRWIAKALAELSDFWLTNTSASAEWLERCTDSKPHVSLPVFSTIGELKALPERRCKKKIIIFGSSGLRAKTYENLSERDWETMRGYEVHDIGRSLDDDSLIKSIDNRRVKRHGILTRDEISELLSRTSLGLLTYPSRDLAKSSVFAAYCSHGVLPIVLTGERSDRDGLVQNEHYVTDMSILNGNDVTLRERSIAAWSWYCQHQTSVHISAFLKLLHES